MRPACQDGVIVADGQLYWGPWMCDCNHSLVGLISLAPSRGLDGARPAVEAERLWKPPSVQPSGAALAGERDWPGYRGGPSRKAATPAAVADSAELLWRADWRHAPSRPRRLPPMAESTGADWTEWSARQTPPLASCSGPPTRAGPFASRPSTLVDESTSAPATDASIGLDATTGKLMWRFRAAPAERRISVHGRLMSNWPVGSGVLVAGDVVYAAAGITSYDGTHVYALDADDGSIVWQNNASGQLAGEDTVTGVSVQGHLLMHDGKLHLAGGNVVSPAVYRLSDGRCLNETSQWWDGLEEAGRFPPKAPSSMFNRSPRGRELFVVDGEVRVFDQLLYSPPVTGRRATLAATSSKRLPPTRSSAAQPIVSCGSPSGKPPQASRSASGSRRPSATRPHWRCVRTPWSWQAS